MNVSKGSGRPSRPLPTSQLVGNRRTHAGIWGLLDRLRSATIGRESGLAPYLYLAPAFILYAVFFLWPFLQLIVLSLQRWDGINPRRWIGLENYTKLIQDEVFWLSFRNNVIWMIAAMTLPVLFGMILAIIIVRSRLHGRVIYRTIYFLPQVLSTVIVAVIWGWIYNPSFGFLNSFLEAVGLESLQRGWLGEPSLALPALFIGWSWIYYGFTMVIFIAAIQGIDEVYFDAAKVDGANRWHQFRHVLVPFIQGPLTIILLITAIAAFQAFDLVFILTRGGPARATMILSIYMYQNAFQFNKAGYGAAVAVALGAIILIISIIFLWLRGTFREER